MSAAAKIFDQLCQDEPRHLYRNPGCIAQPFIVSREARPGHDADLIGVYCYPHYQDVADDIACHA